MSYTPFGKGRQAPSPLGMPYRNGQTPLLGTVPGLQPDALARIGADFRQSTGYGSPQHTSGYQSGPWPTDDPFRVVPRDIGHLDPSRRGGSLAGGSGILDKGREAIGNYGGKFLDFAKDNPEIVFRTLETIGGAFTEDAGEKSVKDDIERRKRQDAARRLILESMQESRKTRDPNNPYLNMHRS